MPPKGAHLPPRAYPHYRAGLTPGPDYRVLSHMLPDGQVIRIHTTQPYAFVVIGHNDLRHKYALACRHALREPYKADYRAMPADSREGLSMTRYVQMREEETYLAAYATPPAGPWALLHWSRSRESAATKIHRAGGEWAGFWEPINNGVRSSNWPIASMVHLPEPYAVPERLRFGYMAQTDAEQEGTQHG